MNTPQTAAGTLLSPSPCSPSPSGSPSSIPWSAHDEYLKVADRAIRMERQRDAAVMLAGELVAIIRVNAMRGTWSEVTPEQVDEFLVPWIAKLRTVQGHSPATASEKLP